MKVILVSGSPHAEGNTYLALKAVAEGIEAEGVETEIISFAGKQIWACTGCNACGNLGKCIHKDDFNEIADKIEKAQGFVIGSPVYFGTARGDVMNFLQRLGMQHKKRDNFLNGKVGGPVAVARRGGQTATLQEMQMFFSICGMTVPGAVYWNMAFGRNQGEIVEDTEGLENLNLFGHNVGKLVKKIYG